MRRHSAFATVRQQIAEATGVENEELIADLQGRGYTAEMVRALPLVPLIEIAWSDGVVSDAERALILEIATQRGIEEGSDARTKLTDWLRNRPTEDVFESGKRLTRAIIEAMPPDRRSEASRSLKAYSTTIASASGGIFGLGSISGKEAAALERLAAELERAHPEATKRVLGPRSE